VQIRRENDTFIRDSSIHTLTFRVERTDDHRLPAIAVRMRGEAIYGEVLEGDRVEIRGDPGPSGVLVTSRIVNLETNSLVEASSRSLWGKRAILIVFLLFVVAFIAYVGFRLITMEAGPPDWFPEGLFPATNRRPHRRQCALGRRSGRTSIAGASCHVLPRDA
jgi:hypothetical protein